jgi:hypothetical protein
MSIFKQKWTKEDMQNADDPRFAPAVMQVPSDAPYAVTPDMHSKDHWPQPVKNLKRPRFGHDY